MAKSVIDSFMDNVNKVNDCWIWTGKRCFNNKYGQFSWNGSYETSHRFSYELFKQAIPAKQCVCHRCDTPLCVNPDHLFLGTQKENLQDMYKKGRHRKKSTYSSGGDHINAVLTNEQAKEIRELYASGNTTYRKLAKQFNICRRSIGRIIKGESYVAK